MQSNVVLLAEDNYDDEILTLRAFRKWRVANPIVVARDGVEALDYIFGLGAYAGRDVTDRPALILLDLRLPKVDAIEVLRRIREDDRTKSTPVVVFTSAADDPNLTRQCSLIGVDGWFHKPVSFEEFFSVVRENGLAWLLLDEPPSLATETALVS